jgi:hypothetical protein
MATITRPLPRWQWKKMVKDLNTGELRQKLNMDMPELAGVLGQLLNINAGPPWTNVQSPQFGAVGDGSRPDTAAIIAAAAATPVGGVLYFPPAISFYAISDVIPIDHQITVLSFGAEIRQSGSGKGGFTVTGSGVRFLGLTLTGRQYAASTSNEIGIYAHGADASHYITDWSVEHCTLTNWGSHGVRGYFVDRFLWDSLNIRNVATIGASGSSSQNGRVVNPYIDNIGNGNSDTYGLTFTQQQTNSLATEPRSRDITVTGGQVRNVTGWEGIDTHGGQRISLQGVQVYGCNTGIALVPAPLVGGADGYAPLDCVVEGCTIESGVTDGTAGAGIKLVGVGTTGSPTELATGRISGNHVTGHGNEANNISGGILIYETSGVPVEENTLKECSPYAVTAYHDNYGMKIVGNTARDTWSNTVAGSAMIAFRAGYSDGDVTGNLALAGAKSATYLNVRGASVDSATSIDLGLWGNDFAACATEYSGTTNGTRRTFRVQGPARVDQTLRVDQTQAFATTPVGTVGILLDPNLVLSGATSQIGVEIDNTLGSDCTSTGIAAFARARTQAAAFTLTTAEAIRAESPAIGAASAIANTIGVHVRDQTGGGTSCKGLVIDNQTGTGAKAIQTGTGVNELGDNLKLTVAGSGLYIKEGSNATMGTATMVGGTVTVSTTKVTANSRIFLTVDAPAGTLGSVYVSTRTASTSFVITSTSALDTSTVSWVILEPA